MARESLMYAISCLAHILHLAGFASDAINEIVAFAGDVFLAFVVTARFGTCDPTGLLQHRAEYTF